MNYRNLFNKILETNGGYIRRSDLVKNGIPTVYLSRLANELGLIKLAPGFYAKNSWPMDGYFILQDSYPNYIFSLTSAIYIHGLGDILPNYYEVTGPKNYRPLSNKQDGLFTHTDTKSETYKMGIEIKPSPNGNPIKVYDLEKTICDIIKYRKSLEKEVFYKALYSYSKKRDKNISKLFSYAKKMGIEKQVLEIMEVVLNGN